MPDPRRSLGLPALVAPGAAGVIGTSCIYANGEFFVKCGADAEIFGLALGAVKGGRAHAHQRPSGHGRAYRVMA